MNLKIPLTVAIIVFVIGKAIVSFNFMRHCINNDKFLFATKWTLLDLQKKNQTLQTAIEKDCQFYLRLDKHRLKNHKDEFKRQYQKYLDFYDGLLQDMVSVFFVGGYFTGYFTVAQEENDHQILEMLRSIHEERTMVLNSMDFNHLKPLDVVLEYKRLQDCLDMLFRSTYNYVNELSPDTDSLTQNTRHKRVCNNNVCHNYTQSSRQKVLCNNDVCHYKASDWFFKDLVVESSALYAILRPCDRSYTIYFLSVLIGQLTEFYCNYETLNVLIECHLTLDMQKDTGEKFKLSELDQELRDIIINNLIEHRNIPYPAVVYCPWAIHAFIMTYCLTYIDPRKAKEKMVEMRNSIYMTKNKVFEYGLWILIGFPSKVWKLFHSLMVNIWKSFLFVI